MLRKKIQASESIKKKKYNKNTVTEDFGITLLKEDQEHDRMVDSSESESEDD